MAQKLTKNKIDAALAYLERKRSSITNRRNGRWIAKQEARLAARLKKRFDRQRLWLVDRVKSMSIFESVEASLERKAYPEEINIIVNELPELDGIADDIETYARAGWRRGARLAYNDLNMDDAGIDFTLSNEAAETYLTALRTLNLSDYRGSISRTTRQRIIRILTEAAESGASYAETSRKIQEQGKRGIFTQERGEMIASNELGRAYGEGNRQMVERFVSKTGAIIEKAWLTVGDDRVTVECSQNEDAGWIPFDGHFPSKDLAAPRHSHPRCRCDTGYREVDTNGEPI